jgi:ATP-dependent helicase/nuclease subunit A
MSAILCCAALLLAISAVKNPMSLIESLQLTPTQQRAALAEGQDVSLAAGAGSGKTRTLVARYLVQLDRGRMPREVVAVTFTEKAAREMRNRIRSEAHAWLVGACPPADRPRWAEIEADVDAARIGTIHGLCAALLKSHPAEAGVDPRFDVLDEDVAATLRAHVVEDTLAWMVGQPALAPLLDAFTVDDLAEIVAHLLNTRLEAGAALAPGATGAWPCVLSAALSAFANDSEIQSAAAELAELASRGDLLEDAGDKLAAQIAGWLGVWQSAQTALAGGHSLQAADALFSLRRLHSGGATGKKTSRAKAAVKAFRERYDASIDKWLGGKESKDQPPDPSLEASTASLLPLLGALFERAQAAYQAEKDVRQALDFDDLEAGAVTLLALPEVRRRWQKQVASLLVDEFQDTNERQRQIVEALAGVADGLSGRLFVVGNAKQSIYRFRGADVGVFQRLAGDIAARGGLPLALDWTFRAHAGLVEGLNEILAAVWDASPGPAEGQGVPYMPLFADRVEPRPGIASPFIDFLVGVGDADAGRRASAQMLARRLGELRAAGEIQWDDVALLFRASTAFPVYESALESAGIPFVTVAGRGFYDRPEIRDLLNILRALADPWDDLALAGLLRSPAFGVSDAGLYQLRWPAGAANPQSLRQGLAGDLGELGESDRAQAARARLVVDDLAGLVDRVSVAELLKQVLEVTYYPAILATVETGTRLQRNVDKLLADAHASGMVRVAEFLEHIATLQTVGAREGEAPAEAGGAVRLMTVHKAKGLEFPVVVVADAARERPSSSERVLLSSVAGLALHAARLGGPSLMFRWAMQAEKTQSSAEDLRVLYVAATRAREKLIVCGHYNGRSSQTWLSQLAGAAGLDLNQITAEPEAWHLVTLAQSGQAVAGIASPLQSNETGALDAPPVAKLVVDSAIPAGAPLYPALHAVLQR